MLRRLAAVAVLTGLCGCAGGGARGEADANKALVRAFYEQVVSAGAGIAPIRHDVPIAVLEVVEARAEVADVARAVPVVVQLQRVGL